MKVKFLIIICFMIVLDSVYAQSGNDEKLENQVLIIYNEYSPVLKDANRIQFLPVIIDTVKIRPKFEYNVNPTRYTTNFQPTPINVATVKGESLKPLDNGMIKLGMGNYLTPYVEAFYNNRREKFYSVGAYAKHHSSHGKTKNTAGQKIYNGYANNIIGGYGKKFFPASTLSGDIGFSSDIVNFYGFDPKVVLPDNMMIPRDRSEMESVNYMRFKAKAGFGSNNVSQYNFNYDVNVLYQYFFTSAKDNQNKIKIYGDMNQMFRSNRFGLDGGFEFNKNRISAESDLREYNEALPMEYKESFLELNPYYKLYSNNWQIRLGLNTTGRFGGEEVKYHFYPNIYIQHNISNVLIPYAGFKGYIVNNNLEYLSTINPFLDPINGNIPDNRDNYQVTNYSQVIDLGIKGNISKKLYFHINANYSKIDNMAFFVNFPANKFVMEYRNVERFSGYGEVVLRDFYKFTFTLNGHYYYYSYVQNEDKPWHMPNFDIGLKTNYKFNEKLNFGMDIFVMGKRYAKVYDPNLIEIVYEKKLKSILDISLYGEYNLSSNFACFLYLNNITGQKQYYWNNYQSQGFNFLLGIKYLF